MDQKTERNIVAYLLDLLSDDSSPTHKIEDIKSKRDRRTAQHVIDFINEIPGGFLIYEANEGERIVYANKALLRIFKCDSFSELKELANGSFRGIVHPDDLDRVENEIADQISKDNDAFDYVEYRIIRKDGILRWVEDYGHFVQTEHAGNYFYVFISDATEKVARRLLEKAELVSDGRKKEQELKNAREQFDAERKLVLQEDLQRLEVIEGLSITYDSIIYADIEKDTALPYRLSPRMLNLFTKKFEERKLTWLFEEYVKRWVHPDDREMMAERTSIDYIRSELGDKKTFYCNYRCVINNETLCFQIRFVNVGEEGSVKQIVIGVRFTDDEVKEEMLQKQMLSDALEKAKIAEVAKNAFLSNMSHDMRTPLNAIYGYLNLAQKAVGDGPVSEYLDKIEIASRQILDMVNKVLELSYSESQDYTVTEEPFNIIDIINREINNASHSAKKKDVTVKLHTDMLTNADVMGDKDKLTQVLGNLIDNAVKYNKKGGTVDITILQNVDLPKFISTFTFEVKDTGIGLSEDALTRVFDPFFRENNTTASGVLGTGLGLTITKRLVHAMNGTISVDSKFGEGSTFTVTIGLRPYMPELDTVLYDENTDLSGIKILIVEDNEINLEIETEILEDIGFTIDSAENGQIAVDKINAAKKGDYDLVLMDIQMPVMDGRTAAREIRKLKDHPLSNIPIIALSANAFESDRLASLDAGMDAHINKPLDVDVLVQAIHAAFKSRAKK